MTVLCNHSCGWKDSATVTWTKNGDDLPFNEANNALILINVTVNDGGYYACAMKDFDGHPSPEVKLNVMCEYIESKLMRYNIFTTENCI